MGEGPAFFLFGCQKSHKRKSGMSGGKADILTAPVSAFQVLFLLHCSEGEQEGRDGDLHRMPVQALYFFLWAPDRQKEED